MKPNSKLCSNDTFQIFQYSRSQEQDTRTLFCLSAGVGTSDPAFDGAQFFQILRCNLIILTTQAKWRNHRQTTSDYRLAFTQIRLNFSSQKIEQNKRQFFKKTQSNTSHLFYIKEHCPPKPLKEL